MEIKFEKMFKNGVSMSITCEEADLKKAVSYLNEYEKYLDKKDEPKPTKFVKEMNKIVRGESNGSDNMFTQPSEKQISILEKYNIPVPSTRSEASEIIKTVIRGEASEYIPALNEFLGDPKRYVEYLNSDDDED